MGWGTTGWKAVRDGRLSRLVARVSPGDLAGSCPSARQEAERLLHNCEQLVEALEAGKDVASLTSWECGVFALEAFITRAQKAIGAARSDWEREEVSDTYLLPYLQEARRRLLVALVSFLFCSEGSRQSHEEIARQLGLNDEHLREMARDPARYGWGRERID